jgi:acetyltransferase-like isoleucine patch superfamily enzyme
MNPGRRLAHDWFPRALPGNVSLGDRSWCYSAFCCLHHRSRRPRAVRVGHDTGIYHGTFFDLGPDGEVEIGNFCTLVAPIIATNARVVIGDHVVVAHEVVLADSFAATPDHHGEEAPGEVPSRGTVIQIGDNCWIGARAMLLSGAHVGSGAIIGAAAVVDSEVPPFAVVGGNPARIVGWAKGSSVQEFD